MMGTSHAISGAAAWVATTAVAPGALGLVPLDPAAVTAGAIICAGAALLPDADHPNATIAHSVPVAGSVVAGAVGAASGGHRHGMHSVVAVVAVAALSWWLGTLWWQPPIDGFPQISIGGTLAAFALTTFAVKVLRVVRRWSSAWVVGAVAALVLMWVMPEANGWLPLCVTLGYVAHLIGDMLTVGGVPLLWPLPIKPPAAVTALPLVSKLWQKNGYFAVPVLGKTGSALEGVLGAFLGLYVFVMLAVVWLQEPGVL